jgi:DNA helicase II / ATP-dependent DNA helicase PcrA
VDPASASRPRGSGRYGTLGGLPIELVAEVFERYEARLRSERGRLQRHPRPHRRALREAPDVLDRVQQRAVFIHVDEYQDTNAAQYELTRLLADKYRNLMAVGDPDQGIYSFRGADIRNILDFQRDYDDADVYRLELNYRSVGSVLRVANALISHNQGRLEKDLRATKGEGEPVRAYRANDHRAEADFVARTVERFGGEGCASTPTARCSTAPTPSRGCWRSRCGAPASRP